MKFKDSTQYYHEVLKHIPPCSEPIFEDPEMQKRIWGQKWGACYRLPTSFDPKSYELSKLEYRIRYKNIHFAD